VKRGVKNNTSHTSSYVISITNALIKLLFKSCSSVSGVKAMIYVYSFYAKKNGEDFALFSLKAPLVYAKKFNIDFQGNCHFFAEHRSKEPKIVIMTPDIFLEWHFKVSRSIEILLILRNRLIRFIKNYSKEGQNSTWSNAAPSRLR
jgi:hypothetical protein